MFDESQFNIDAAIERVSKIILRDAKKYGHICYRCVKCGALTSKSLTSYHQQVHGEQEIYYNPLPK
jgi:hypothetical protein